MILDIDESGVAGKFQSRTFKVARFCARKQQEPVERVNVEVQLPPRIFRVEDGSDDGCIFRRKAESEIQIGRASPEHLNP